MYASLGRADRNPPTSVFSKPTLKRKLLKCGMSGESRPSLFSIDRKVELTEQLRLIDPFAVGKGERSQLFSLQRQRKGAKTARGLAMSGPTNRFVSLSGPGFAFVSAPPTLSPPPQLAVALEAQIALGKGKIERFGVLAAIEFPRVPQTLSGGCSGPSLTAASGAAAAPDASTIIPIGAPRAGSSVAPAGGSFSRVAGD